MAKASFTIHLRTGKMLDAKVAKYTKIREWHKDEARKASAVLKVLQEKRQGAMKKAFRHVAAEAAAAAAGGRPVRAIGDRLQVGRKERWPGHCLTCLMRHLGEPGGGPHHVKSICAKTQVVLKARPAWVTKTFRKY